MKWLIAKKWRVALLLGVATAAAAVLPPDFGELLLDVVDQVLLVQ